MSAQRLESDALMSECSEEALVEDRGDAPSQKIFVASGSALQRRERRRRFYTIACSVLGLTGVAVLLVVVKPGARPSDAEVRGQVGFTNVAGYPSSGSLSVALDVITQPPSSSSTLRDGICGAIYCQESAVCCNGAECCSEGDECCGGLICCGKGNCVADGGTPYCKAQPNCGHIVCEQDDMCCGVGEKMCCGHDAICCGGEICCSKGSRCQLDPSPICLAPEPNCGLEYCDKDAGQFCCDKMCCQKGAVCCGSMCCAPNAVCSDPPNGGVCLIAGTR